MWERIDDETTRLRVPGGWIVRTRISVWDMTSRAVSVHHIFVSDPAHTWEIYGDQR